MTLFSIEPIAERMRVLAGERSVIIVAIDGGGGAGKSTLATELADATGASVVHGDDFYRVMDDQVRAGLTPAQAYRHYFDWERQRDHLLAPLRSNRPAVYRRYDWARNELGDWARVEPNGVVVLEGVYSCRPELRRFYDVAVLVDTPREVRLARLRRRGENPEEWIQRWEAANEWYFKNVLAWHEFDLVLDGDSAMG